MHGIAQSTAVECGAAPLTPMRYTIILPISVQKAAQLVRDNQHLHLQSKTARIEGAACRSFVEVAMLAAVDNRAEKFISRLPGRFPFRNTFHELSSEDQTNSS